MDFNLKKCPVCSADTKQHESWPQHPNLIVTCPRCGIFRTSLLAFPHLQEFEFKSILSGVLRERSERLEHRRDLDESEKWRGRIVRGEGLDDLIRGAPQRVWEKLNAFLLATEARTKFPGAVASFNDNTDYPLAYCCGILELHYIVANLIERGFLRHHARESRDFGVIITEKGWAKLESLHSSSVKSNRGFIAMSFAGELNEAFTHGLSVGIARSGHQPTRVDKEEFNDGVFDKVIALIRQSRFLVADLTGTRPNVYLEVGFAQGLGIPVILTCRDTDINKVQFDLKHLNVIVWSSPADLAARLENRIAAVIGRSNLLV